MNETRKGEIYILSEAVLWSLFPVITLLSFNSLKPLASLTLSYATAGLFFAGVLTYKKLWHEIFIKHAFLDVLRGALIIAVLSYFLQFLALKHTTAGNAAVILQMEIFFSYLVFNVWKKEYLDSKHIFGALLMLFGALVVLLPKSSHVNSGDYILLLAAALSPFGNIFQQRARKTISSYSVIFLRTLISLPIILVAAIFLRQGFSLSEIKNSWWLIAINGVFLFGLSKILWLEAIHRISVVKANAITCIGPLFTIIFAYFLLKQSPTVWQLLAILPLAIGVIILTKPTKKTSR
jgi:drug/metabolite transporter (DMT)-like permease